MQKQMMDASADTKKAQKNVRKMVTMTIKRLTMTEIGAPRSWRVSFMTMSLLRVVQFQLYHIVYKSQVFTH